MEVEVGAALRWRRWSAVKGLPCPLNSYVECRGPLILGGLSIRVGLCPTSQSQ